MKEENIDERIERVIRSVSTKKKDMAMWSTENAKMKLRKRRIINFGISAAASVAVFAIVGICYLTFYWKESGPTSDLSPSPLSYEYGSIQPSPEYSNDTTDIEAVKSLINTGKYEDAFDAIEAIEGDTIINYTIPEDRKQQIRMLHYLRKYELEWLKIETLIKLNKKTEAIDLLNQYVKKEGAHKINAQQLLENLNDE